VRRLVVVVLPEYVCSPQTAADTAEFPLRLELLDVEVRPRLGGVEAI
jgi:hypothetical protein